MVERASDIVDHFFPLGQRKEIDIRSAAASRGSGGLMLRVLPLAREGLGPSEISERLGIKYESIKNCMYSQRTKGRLAPPMRVLKKKLIEQLRQPPDDPYERLKLLKMLSFDLYRKNLDMFATVLQVCTQAGSRDLALYQRDEVITGLRIMGVASTRFMVKCSRKSGKRYIASWNVILKEDETKAVSAVKRVFNL